MLLVLKQGLDPAAYLLIYTLTAALGRYQRTVGRLFLPMICKLSLDAIFIRGLIAEHVETKEQKRIDCDGIFIAAGYLPQNEMVKGQVTLTEAGYIQTDARKKTNLPGVYAIGDISTTPLRQVVTACADGAVAVASAEQYLSED